MTFAFLKKSIIPVGIGLFGLSNFIITFLLRSDIGWNVILNLCNLFKPSQDCHLSSTRSHRPIRIVNPFFTLCLFLFLRRYLDRCPSTFTPCATKRLDLHQVTYSPSCRPLRVWLFISYSHTIFVYLCTLSTNAHSIKRRYASQSLSLLFPLKGISPSTPLVGLFNATAISPDHRADCMTKCPWRTELFRTGYTASRPL